jgi:hypothetical protein
LLLCFHTLFLLLVVSYWKVIFTDAGGVPYELDEAWVSAYARILAQHIVRVRVHK